MRTTHCVRCLVRPATIYCGHIKQGRRKILAGWCKFCDLARRQPSQSWLGWYGHWTERMGLEEGA